MNIKWTIADKNFIRENADRLKDGEIAKALTINTGRVFSLESVRKMRQKMGIKKHAGRGVCGVINDGISTPKNTHKKANVDGPNTIPKAADPVVEFDNEKSTVRAPGRV